MISKKDEKYVCLLLFNSIANIFLKSLCLVWASFFKVGYFNLINSVSNLLFIETDFCKARCNPGLHFVFQFLYGYLMEDIYQWLHWIFWKNIQIRIYTFLFWLHDISPIHSKTVKNKHFLIKLLPVCFVNIRLKWWWT